MFSPRVESNLTGDLNNVFRKLNNNEISWTIEDMMGAFAGLENLRKLSLASNLIKSIAKHAFKGLHKLTELDLSNNSVTSIQNTSFIDLKSLKKL